jgi:hypothetical protein
VTAEDTEETWATAEAEAEAEAEVVATAEAEATAEAVTAVTVEAEVTEAGVTAVTAEVAETITTTLPPQRGPARVRVGKCPGTRLAFTCVGCSTS